MTNDGTILETARLSLRRWTAADGEALFEIMRDAAGDRRIGDRKPFTMEKTEDFLVWTANYERENGFCRWKVIEKPSGKTIGSCGFAALPETGEIDLGYLLAQNARRKGYATEIAAAAIDYGFKKLGFREIIAMTDPENAASRKVLEKIGFRARQRSFGRRRKFSLYKEKI